MAATSAELDKHDSLGRSSFPRERERFLAQSLAQPDPWASGETASFRELDGRG